MSMSHNKNSLPKYFGKHGHQDQNPNETKKGGHGKGNWGKPEDDIEDLVESGEFNTGYHRRRTNSNGVGNIQRPDFNKMTDDYEQAIVEEEAKYQS